MGTGYTRNDTANNIADGNVINASDLDGEFDAVQAAFHGTTGHSHDGTSGEGPKIDTGGLANDAVTADILDETATFTMAGLSVTGNTVLGDAASDTVTVTADIASDLIPSADGTHDLGASGAEWQDLFIDGTANIDSLVADTADINGGSVDGVTIGTNSAATEVQIDNININGNAITSTDTNGNIALTPNGTGEVDISKVDIAAGEIDGVTIGTNSAVTDLRVDNIKVDGNTVSSTDTNGDINLSPNGTGTVVINTDLDVDNINVNGNTITSTDTNGNINITPNGSGAVVIDGLSHPTADGSAGQFLKTDGSGTLSFDTVTGYSGWTVSDGSNSENIASTNTVTFTGAGTVTTGYNTGTNVLTITGAAEFASGTSMLFQQSSAPTGWTKQTTHNDKALRIVTGSVSTGGSVAFSTAFATPSVSGSVSISGAPAKGNLAGNATINGNPNVSGNVSSHTLSVSQMPSHSHGGINNPERTTTVVEHTVRVLVLQQTPLTQVVAGATTTVTTSVEQRVTLPVTQLSTVRRELVTSQVHCLPRQPQST